jgi:hypothetical protein
VKVYVDEIGSPIGPVICATSEEGALLGLRFRDGRYSKTLEEGLKRVPHPLPKGRVRTGRDMGGDKHNWIGGML